MIGSAVLTYHDGKLDVPEELRAELHLLEGSRLHVVYSKEGKVLLDLHEPVAKSMNLTSPADSPAWARLQGFLTQASRSPNDVLEEERVREITLDVKPS